MGQGIVWSKAEVAHLCRLRNEGKQFSDIALELQRTEKACRHAWARFQPNRPRKVWKSWGKNELQRAIELYRNGKSALEIGKTLGRSVASVNCIIKNNRQSFGYYSKDQLKAIYVAANAGRAEHSIEPELARERRDLACRFTDKAVRVLFLSDVHVPFHHPEVLRRVFEERADILLLGGDFLDEYSVSRFRKERHISLEHELRDGAQLMVALAEHFPHVVSVMGNHDQRLWKMVQDALPREAAEVVQGSTNLIAKVAEGLSNVTILNGWWCQLGRVIFCHRERYRKNVGLAIDDGIEYFLRLGVNFEAVVTGHLHRMDGPRPHLRKWGIENGCACIRQDYTLRSDSLNAEYQCGYTIVEIAKDGHFDPNRSRPFFIAWE